MTDQNKNNLWEELKLLQATVNKFDDFSFRIKNWFIIVVIAITGYAINKTDKKVLFINFGVALIFYLYEITYRIAQGDFLKRLRDVQRFLRMEADLLGKYKSPNMDIYLFDTNNISGKNIFFRAQKCFNLEDDRAKRNVRELNLISSHAWKYLFQLRISLLYLLVLLGNTLLLYLYFKCT
jgi:hypothetical protein